ncbi:enoyl-CoA hydratase [Alteromonas oceanisediminis]|uniref:enoyl-CoA hydratase n=1 Tax=Alteromonas oceanisediminis TaxID=2836180 RepID=UPI001BDAE83D|nr:enoyl-CoA hydratase [Alteromonas oceanisediminis]MBT0586381.1 enoyl-CoA hydratase [Alteromonas oceanisediminis]
MSDINTQMVDHVLRVVINRPAKKNSLTREMYEQMAQAIERARDDGARVIVIEGEGDCFTAGNNIADFASVDEAEHVNETAHFMNALMHCDLPVVAKVRGLAVGIGTTLLLHCDLVYCDDSAKFVMPFIDLGLVPEYASSYILPRVVGHRKASEWLMLGKPFGADEAKHFGIVNDVFSAAELDSVVDTIVDALRAKPALALKNTKKLMKSDVHNVDEHMAEELDFFIDAMRSEPAQEAFAAFLQKRPVNKEKFK